MSLLDGAQFCLTVGWAEAGPPATWQTHYPPNARSVGFRRLPRGAVYLTGGEVMQHSYLPADSRLMKFAPPTFRTSLHGAGAFSSIKDK